MLQSFSCQVWECPQGPAAPAKWSHMPCSRKVATEAEEEVVVVVVEVVSTVIKYKLCRCTKKKHKRSNNNDRGAALSLDDVKRHPVGAVRPLGDQGKNVSMLQSFSCQVWECPQGPAAPAKWSHMPCSRKVATEAEEVVVVVVEVVSTVWGYKGMWLFIRCRLWAGSAHSLYCSGVQYGASPGQRGQTIVKDLQDGEDAGPDEEAHLTPNVTWKDKSNSGVQSQAC
ncbi:hypothetical protein CRUP_023859 [Coryphaenoides rupestris]|nr:hypothetical protein CRUP_023859 [Coryphaenoides rupestris]